MKMKRQSSSRRDRKDDKDRISDLPDCVLLHIMKFMDTKDAVRTCILSKRWRDLWKCLTNLTFDSSDFRRVANFRKFVSRVLSCRDGSISLLNLDFMHHRCIEPKFLNRVMRYAVLHNVQQLTIHINLYYRFDFEFRPFIFSCSSLTFLELDISCCDPSMIELPKSLQLPALQSLLLGFVTFIASDNDCAEPFSACNMLKSLVLRDCFLHHDAKFLRISNANLSSLTLNSFFDSFFEVVACKIVLSTPNLSSLTIVDYFNLQLSSTCNLSLLKEVDIDTCAHNLVFIKWLQVLANVKIMTFAFNTLKIILDDISNPGSIRSQPPCFVRLETLKMKMTPSLRISDEEVKRIVEYLLQNSSLDRAEKDWMLAKHLVSLLIEKERRSGSRSNQIDEAELIDCAESAVRRVRYRFIRSVEGRVRGICEFLWVLGKRVISVELRLWAELPNSLPLAAVKSLLLDHV
ncbi:hypothetical protein VNO77_33544 [Canavalia gladiata]|uniref:F-box domain-containing protein n=1 Tax=Canavalia gladiata TaxID=3824 RepID=A0AAN9KCM4_CANGL